MNIELPDINIVITSIQQVESKFDGISKPISEWVNEHREYIRKNKSLLESKSDENDIKILITLLNDFLMRSMSGERGSKIKTALENNLKEANDLHKKNYHLTLIEAKYRFVKDGTFVMNAVAEYFSKELKWNWISYFSDADSYHKTNFTEDELLKIKGLKFKVRDLALSNFNPNYAANDLHIVRVSTRLGLLNYGFDLLADSELEMGNDPSNKKNYLFLHRLFLKLSDYTDKKWLLADFDRSFWHFGRTICNDKPKCNACPVNDICLTGKTRTSPYN